MQTVETWRSALIPKDVAITAVPDSKISIFDFIPHKARCGHISPPAYVVAVDGKTFNLMAEEMSSLCPSCMIRHIREGFAENIASAIPCASCGNPIIAGSVIGVCVLLGKEPEFPIVQTEEGYMILCSGCACMGANVYGHWDGAKAVRLARNTTELLQP